MTVRFLCHHGHLLEISDDIADQQLVCGRCGSVTATKVGGNSQSQFLDATIASNIPVGEADPAPQVDSAAPSLAKADDSTHDPDDSLFLSEEQSRISGRSGVSVGGQASASIRSTQPVTLVPPRLEGYEILEELGRGGMGVVYRARNETLGRDVALKTLQRLNPKSLHRFKQEFRTLADIAHPNLASLYELLSDGETWCFSMEILEGVSFLEYIWSGCESLESGIEENPLEPCDDVRLNDERMQRLTSSMTQLTLGLAVLHDAGILHSDIKPSNVLVTKEGRLVLLDFGLAVAIDQIKKNVTTVQGTPLYMSPEQGRGESLTEASDWYSVGVMLYEVLAGKLPLTGSTREIIARKQNAVPLEPLELQPSIPKPLNDLCVALLSREAGERPTAEQILNCFGAPELAEKIRTSRRTAATVSAELVGRETHLRALRESFAKVQAGDTVSTFVQGKSGMGKSVLVRRFLDEVVEQDVAIVLEGRCYEQESVPFKALDSLIDALVMHLEAMADDIVQSVMPSDRLALTRVFPVLGKIPGADFARYPTIDNADQQELRQRAMNALRELLQRLAMREPLVLYIEDLQWGDVDSAGLLVDLVRPPQAPQMLLLGSYRSEDAQSSLCLKALSEAYKKGQHLPLREEVSVDSLNVDESTRLALMLLGRDDETTRAHAKKIAQESNGSPFFVWELAQHVQEDPTITDQSLELDEVIWTRVSRMPEETVRLLETIAIAGRPLPAAHAYLASDSVANGPALLAQLRTSSFVRTTESEQLGTMVETYHDRIRESVSNHLPDNTVRGHNLKLAKMILEISEIRVEQLQGHIDRTPAFDEPSRPFQLDKRQWQHVFDMAVFFDAAGEHATALPYALVAAEQSRQQNALEVSEQQYRIALRGAENASPELRFRILEGLGDVLMFRGQYDDANKQFEMARTLVNGNLLLARLDYKIGVATFKRGDMGDARQFFEKALRALGERPPSTWSVIPRVLKEAFVQVMHTKFPSWFVGRRSAASAQAQLDLFRARVYDQLTISYWFSRGMNFVLWSHLRTMNLAERYPPSSELGTTYAFHAVTMTGIPMAERGIAYAQKAHRISVENGDLWGQGKALGYHTFSCIVLARFREGVQTGSEAVKLLDQAGDVWESNMARMIATVPRYHLGDLESAYRESRKAYEIGLETGDYSAVCISLLFWIPCHPQSVPRGAIRGEMERPREDPLTIAGVVYARGLELLLCEDKPKEAAKVLRESQDQAKRLGLRNPCLFSAVTWRATALRIVAEREPEGAQRRRAIGEAKSAVRAAIKITKKYRACRAQALRERGLLAALEGNEQQARRDFDESTEVAQAQEARYEEAKTLLARAQTGIKFDWPLAEDQLAEAQYTLAKIEDFAE